MTASEYAGADAVIVVAGGRVTAAKQRGRPPRSYVGPVVVDEAGFVRPLQEYLDVRYGVRSAGAHP